MESARVADIEAELEHILRRHPVSTMADLERLDNAEVQEGYRDGHEGLPCGDNRSRSYWHGWRNGMIDTKRIESDWASQMLAGEYIKSNNRPTDTGSMT
jgi:hypothetical protein